MMFVERNVVGEIATNAGSYGVIPCVADAHDGLYAILTELCGGGYSRLIISNLEYTTTSSSASELAFGRYLSLSDKWPLFFLRTHARAGA